MADKYISKIKDTNNDINYLKYGIYPVKGTQTSTTGAWTGNINVPALYDGLTIAYYLPYDGNGNATLNLTLSDGTTTGAINCYYSGNDRLSTQYEAGHIIIFTYQSAGSIKINGVDTTDNRWITNSTIEDSSSYIEDQDPYICRASKAEMDREFLDKIVGGSLGWNQIANPVARTASGVTITVSNGVITFNGTSTAVVYFNLNTAFRTATNHVYYIKKNQSQVVEGVTIYNVSNGIDVLAPIDEAIQKSTGEGILYVRINSGVTLNNITMKPQVFDLTQTFGSTIADYMLSLGSANGIAWLSQYIDLSSYHTYDAGSIQSVQATAHVTTGFNQWDEAWEVGTILDTNGQNSAATNRIRSTNYIPIFAGSSYYIKSPRDVKLYWYDGNKNFISASSGWTKNAVFNPNTSAKYMRFILETAYGTVYANDICISFSKPTGTPKNGDYVPYNGHTYPLGSDTLRGYPMLINNKLAFDGDIKTPDGTTRRRYGIVDLGSLNWTYNSTAATPIFSTSLNSLPATCKSNSANMVCPKYEAKYNFWNTAGNDKCVASGSMNLNISDSNYNNAATFKTAMSGVYLVYPLETESMESSVAYQQVQMADPDGTEGFTTTSLVPVGHYTRYPANLRAILSNEFIDDISNTIDIARNYIKTITRSGTTFTATRANGSTFSFTQQDSSGGGTTYANVTSSAAGLAPASGNTANKVLRVSPSGDPIWGSDDSRELMPFNNPTTNSTNYRLTSANITPNNNGSIRTFLATSNMTTDTRPANDGNILHFSWDNQNRWGSQMAICHGNPPIVQVRHQTGAGQNDWGPWKKLIRQDDLATTADNGLTPKLNGSTLQHLRGDGTWAIPRQASRIIDANNNSSEISVRYSGAGINGASWIAAFNGYSIEPMSTAVLKSIVDTNTTYADVTTSTHGLMTAADKIKLNAMSTVDNDTKKEAFFEWGGKNLTGTYSPVDAALVGWLGANRFAGIPAAAVTVEYTRDGGSTWTDYGASDAAKRDFFTSRNNFIIGKADSTNKATANGNKYQLRITINTQTGNVYTALNKFIIYLSTNGSANCTVKVQAAIQNTPDNYVDITGDVALSGWSGWNVVNVSPFTTYGNQVASQYGRVRFIFKANGGNTSYNGMNIFSIYGYGGMGWTTPSDLARSGQLYSYDGSLNATFPANVTAQSETLNGGLTFSKAATNAIQYTGTCATYPMIKFMDQADGNGNGMAIGGGGAVIIGGGESSNAAMAQVAGGSEVLYLCNDGNVNIFTNMQNGWASRKEFYFDTNGDFHAPRYIYGTYLNASNGAQTPSSTSYWIYANSDGFLRKSTPANALANMGAAKATEAIKSITRSGVTFTATRCDGSTFSFTQQDNNNTYNFSGATFYSGNSSSAEHNANNALKNGHYYYTSNGPTVNQGATTTDGALYVQSYSDSWVGQIAQDYRDGTLFVRGKNNGTWTTWNKILQDGVAIPKNVNLNDYKQTGFYYTDANATAATWTNSPTANACILKVYRYPNNPASTGGMVHQECVEYMTSGFKTWHRNFYNNSWGSWIEWKLTDTNTWRGIQNVLTSTSTTDSLSAAQGKALADNAIKNITRSGVTFTATKINGSTFSFTQQDSNTTYGLATTAANGLAPKLNNSASYYLNGTGAWTIPSNTSTGGTITGVQYKMNYSGTTTQAAQLSRLTVTYAQYGTLVNNEPTLLFYDSSGNMMSWYSLKRAFLRENTDNSHSGYVVHGENPNHGYTLDWTSTGLNVYVDTTNVGRVTLTSSDARVKTDIKPLGQRYKDAIQTLDLKEFRYDFRDPIRSEANGLKRFGVVAQDVIAALDEQGLDWQKSELVETTKDDDNEYYTVNYIPLLITRLAGDEDRIKQLENTVASLTARLEALEQKLKNL